MVLLLNVRLVVCVLKTPFPFGIAPGMQTLNSLRLLNQLRITILFAKQAKTSTRLVPTREHVCGHPSSHAHALTARRSVCSGRGTVLR